MLLGAGYYGLVYLLGVDGLEDEVIGDGGYELLARHSG